MKIGFVSTWLERGATYVTKTYIDLLKDDHEVFVYARGGETLEKNNPKFNSKEVTWGLRLGATKIDWKNFSRWVKKNELDVIFFNEQHDVLNVIKTKKIFPKIKLGAYIDYYTEETVKEFEIYDFLICNTKRHYEVFKWHKNTYYIPWGTNLDIFKYSEKNGGSNQITFFHSSGMSARKGTDVLIRAFIEGEFYKKNAKLIIHSQKSLDHILSYEEAIKYNIEIIINEVAPPGLYHLGDVYVYPTTLDGLGLTIYEALASGMPVITTDDAPMNEIINADNNNGKLVDVEYKRARKDGYYWPQSFIDKNSLINAMDYYCGNIGEINEFKDQARIFAEEKLQIKNQKSNVKKIFERAPIQTYSTNELDLLIKSYNHKEKKKRRLYLSEILFPNRLNHIIRLKAEEKRNADGSK